MPGPALDALPGLLSAASLPRQSTRFKWWAEVLDWTSTLIAQQHPRDGRWVGTPERIDPTPRVMARRYPRDRQGREETPAGVAEVQNNEVAAMPPSDPQPQAHVGPPAIRAGARAPAINQQTPRGEQEAGREVGRTAHLSFRIGITLRACNRKGCYSCEACHKAERRNQIRGIKLLGFAVAPRRSRKGLPCGWFRLSRVIPFWVTP